MRKDTQEFSLCSNSAEGALEVAEQLREITS